MQHSSALRRAVAAGLLAVALPALAAYPDKPIQLIVPYTPGGGTDAVARLVAEKLGTRVGQSVLVVNRPGANGNIGADSVAKAAPDGYTLLLGGIGPLAVNPGIFEKMPYDPSKAFAPVVMVALVPLAMVAGPSAPFTTLDGLTAFAKAHPGKLFAANAGEGSPEHLCAGMFAKAAGVDIAHVPYKGSAPAITDLLGGSVNVMCENIGTIRPFILSNKVRPLAVSTTGRSELLPQVPTFAEAGVANVDLSAWFAVVAPAGTPTEVLDMLNREINLMLKTTEVQNRLAESAYVPLGGSVAAAAAFLKSEQLRLPALVRALGITRQ